VISERNITDKQINELYRGRSKNGNPIFKLVPATSRNRQIFNAIGRLHKNGKLKNRRLNVK